MFRVICLLAICFSLLKYGSAQQLGLFKDSRDETVYKTVKIGNQEWLAENLTSSRFQNGKEIPQARSKEEWLRAGYRNEPIWCFYKFDSSYSKYGKLYNYYALISPNNLAPRGWRVPTFFDYLLLINYIEPLYNFDLMLDNFKSNAGDYLKSKNGRMWGDEQCTEISSNFNAIPAGGYSPSIDNPEYDWDPISDFAGFWCLTDWKEITNKIVLSKAKRKDKILQDLKKENNKENALEINLNRKSCNVDFDDDPMSYGRSIRLIRDKDNIER